MKNRVGWIFGIGLLLLSLGAGAGHAHKPPRPKGSRLIAHASEQTRQLYAESQQPSQHYAIAEQTDIPNTNYSLAQLWWAQAFARDVARIRPGLIYFDPPTNAVDASYQSGYEIVGELVGVIRSAGYPCGSLVSVGGEMVLGSQTWGVVCDRGKEDYVIFFDDDSWWLRRNS